MILYYDELFDGVRFYQFIRLRIIHYITFFNRKEICFSYRAWYNLHCFLFTPNKEHDSL